jgi:hypothetical protein
MLSAIRSEHPVDRYVIKVRGEAGPAVRAVFDGFDLTVEDDVTVLRGNVEDRAALYGVLLRLEDFSIDILEVRREDPLDEPVTSSATPEENGLS